ncbi:MAG: T6SS immunity protein Tdi1 domain-containing protein [Candidatus Kapaibacterium sp.]
MFSKFETRYSSTFIDPQPSQLDLAFLRDFDSALTSLLSAFAGHYFNNGVYRVFAFAKGVEITSLVCEAFPTYEGAIYCFGCDWLGNPFAIEKEREGGAKKRVLLFDLGTGEVLEIPGDISAFHNETLIADADAAIEEELFNEWSAEVEVDASTLVDKCMGYVIPLFLGGVDDLENLQLSDLTVYIDITGQLILGVRNLKNGDDITQIEIR